MNITRTYWQRFSLDGRSDDTFEYDYMGNAEYEYGEFPKAMTALRAVLPTATTKVITKLPFKFDYVTSNTPKALTFYGSETAINEFLETVSGGKIENKAGYFTGRPIGFWVPVMRYTGFVVLNHEVLNERGLMQEALDYVAYLAEDPAITQARVIKTFAEIRETLTEKAIGSIERAIENSNYRLAEKMIKIYR